jgi:hypothetical protein
VAWGGSRKGSGRKAKNSSALPDLDIQHALAEPAPEDIEAAARRHAVMALAPYDSDEIKIAAIAMGKTKCTFRKTNDCSRPRSRR